MVGLRPILLLGSGSFLLFCSSAPLLALPPPEDTPEEVLRTAIITAARSPIDGKPLTAAEYAELRFQLESSQQLKPQVNPKIRQLIFLLHLRHLIRQMIPFLKI